MTENELLQSIHKTAEMGCEGILCVLDYTKDSGLQAALHHQMREYRGIEHDVEQLLSQKGDHAKDVGTMAKMSARMMSTGKLMADRSTSKIAEMTIQGNNMGITKTLQNLHRYQEKQGPVVDLTNRFLTLQRDNAAQLEKYL